MEQVKIAGGRALQVSEGGAPDGVPVLVHHGTPGSGLLDPSWEADARERGLRLVTYARPGYGRSDRDAGRSVADGASDSAALADSLGIDRFLTWGVSGGGPHALACAAMLPDRVVAAASLASVAPYDAEGLDFFAGMGEGNIKEFGLVVEGGEASIRALTEQQAAEITAATQEQMVTSMAPFLTPADKLEMSGPLGATLLAMFQDGMSRGADGWVDDDIAFVAPWGFDPADITVSVLLWQGRLDAMVPFGHGEWLATRIPGVDARLTDDDSHLSLISRRTGEVHQWLRSQWDARGDVPRV